jgi:DNA-binding MarR family transcriptional regulator/DNA-binding XRE family transcriptional regulator
MERTASELLRALRGRRSQVQLARRLGYRGNPITDWERGQRFPTAEEALRVAALCGVDVRAAFVRFSPTAPLIHGGRAPRLAEWLSALRGSASLAELSKRCESSRFSVARWLNGRAKPRLPDFLRLVDALTGRAPEWVGELIPIERVPSVADRYRAAVSAKNLAFEAPWTEVVMRLVETTAYREQPRHRPGWISERLGISSEEEASCVARLEAAGLIARRGRRYVVSGQHTVDTQGGRKALHRLKQHWASVAAGRLDAPRASDVFAYNVMSVSRADLERIREKLRATFREIRQIVSASQPEAVAALLNVQLVVFDPESAPEPRPA